MSKTNRNRLPWLALPLTGAVLLALVGWLAAASPTQAAIHAVSIEDATVAPGGSVTVSLDAVAPAAGIGAIDATVTYDTAVVNATACTANAAWDVGDCTIDSVAGTVRLLAADVTGLGSGSLATIAFDAVGAAGTSSALVISADIFALPDETRMEDTLTVTDGSITITEAPTPTATPAPGTPTATPAPGTPTATPAPGTPTATPAPGTPTATPAPAPEALPPTGGEPSDGGFSGLAWLAAIAGALAMMSGGLWLALKRRRVR